MSGTKSWILVGLATLLAACSSGSETSVLAPPTGAPASPSEAARFLSRATFGPTVASVQQLQDIGYEAWFELQLTAPTSLQRPSLEQVLVDVPVAVFENDRQRKALWWSHTIEGPDQLRQRMAWALSQLLVVSTRDLEVFDLPLGNAEYYDILSRHALGNYRELLEEVTLSPVMGRYLDMLGNRSADPLQNLRPDENFAREVLQLFSIGLVQLEPDGTPRLGDGGIPLATYGQAEVEGFARVFTGWTYGSAEAFTDPAPTAAVERGVLPMQLFEEYHEQGEKLLLDGFVQPANQGGAADLQAALDQIAAHPNVGPFVARHLIQRLTRSNPSAAYVGRVAAVFADDGAGERGNLFAVARAILTDAEALTPAGGTSAKLREPLLRQTGVWRAFEARSDAGNFLTATASMEHFAQGPLEAPSVFNFYAPDFVPKGALQEADLVAPEFEITTHKGIADGTNRLMNIVLEGYRGYPYVDPDQVLIDLGPLQSLGADTGAMVDQINLLIFDGQLSEELVEVLTLFGDSVPLDSGANIGIPQGLARASEVLGLAVAFPEAALQR